MELLLDRIDGRRHDTTAILDAVNAFGSLSEAEADEHFGPWEYAGLDDAQHPISALLPEGHNGTCVVRDLDGSLNFLWQEESTSERWLIGPLYREHLRDIEEVEELLEGDAGWLVDNGIPVSPDELGAVLGELPETPGPVVSF
jgi:hypothetical protein